MFIEIEQKCTERLLHGRHETKHNDTQHDNIQHNDTSGLYYKHMKIVNDDSSIFSKQSFQLIDDARGVIYDRRMFIIQATAFRDSL